LGIGHARKREIFYDIGSHLWGGIIGSGPFCVLN